MKKVDALCFAYQILTDSRNANKYSAMHMRDYSTMEITATYQSAVEAVRSAWAAARDKEDNNENR